MTQPEPITDVVFRRWRGEDQSVLALFPCEPGTYDVATCSSYAHIGQHGSANYALCIGATVPVDESDPDVQALRRELESPPYSYRLRVLKRSPPWWITEKARKATCLAPRAKVHSS